MNILHFLPEFIRRAVAASISYEIGRLGLPAEFAQAVMTKIEEVLGVV